MSASTMPSTWRTDAFSWCSGSPVHGPATFRPFWSLTSPDAAACAWQASIVTRCYRKTDHRAGDFLAVFVADGDRHAHQTLLCPVEFVQACQCDCLGRHRPQVFDRQA